jgi:hypothetical protein
LFFVFFSPPTGQYSPPIGSRHFETLFVYKCVSKKKLKKKKKNCKPIPDKQKKKKNWVHLQLTDRSGRDVEPPRAQCGPFDAAIRIE